MNYPAIPLPGYPFQYYPPIYTWVFQIVSFPPVHHQNLHATLNSPIPATWPAMTFFSVLSPEQYCVSRTDWKVSHYVVFPLPSYLVPLSPKYSPQHPILKQPQPTFFPQCERPSFTPIQNNRRNYNSVYIDLKIFLGKLDDKRSAPNGSKHFLNSICS